MSDPNERSGISVTLKQDGKDGTWIVFHGSPERVGEDIAQTFGMSPETVADMDLVGQVVEATRVYKGMATVGRVLGGRQTKGGSEAWAQARDAAPAEPARDPLYVDIEEQTSVDGLKKLWAENRATFDNDAELFAAWKAKGKSIKESNA